MGLRSLVVTASVVAAGAALTAVYACTPDEHRRSSPGGVTTTTEGRCTAAPGEFAGATCSTSDDTCTPATGSVCTIDETKCGSKSTCLPLKNNTGPILDFRLRRLNVIAPSALTFTTSPIVQTTIINDSISLKEKACGELGKGTFSLLLQLDNTSGKMTIGGAPPPTDPFGAGYCFFKDVVLGLSIQPVTVTATLAEGKYESAPIPKLLIPIFLDDTGKSVIILPLTNAILKDVNVSPDGNCIGAFNPDALNADCYDDYSTCSKWKTAGTLGAFITLEEADGVFIKELNSSLCVLLTGTAPDAKCKREGNKFVAKGDYCSSPIGPGGCQDSFWLAATFAASAVTINDGAKTPSCKGGISPVDAGAEAGPEAGADAAHD